MTGQIVSLYRILEKLGAALAFSAGQGHPA